MNGAELAREELVSALEPRPGERWLDVGTGAGGVAALAARRGAQVTGVDVSAEAIEQARRRGVGEFRVADAAALPFGDASFDVVSSAAGIDFVRDQAAAARELARVARPAGRLGLVLIPRESPSGELWALLRAVRPHREAPGTWPDRADELLGQWFELEQRSLELPDVYPPAGDADDAWTGGPTAELDEDERRALWPEFVDILRRWEGRPKSCVLLVGKRR